MSAVVSSREAGVSVSERVVVLWERRNLLESLSLSSDASREHTTARGSLCKNKYSVEGKSVAILF